MADEVKVEDVVQKLSWEIIILKEDKRLLEIKIKQLTDDDGKGKQIVKLTDKVDQLEHDLKEQKVCYKSAAARAKQYKAKIAIIKEAINL